MDEQIIFIYSLCDDLLTSFGTNKEAHCKMSCAEVMTVAIVAALFFGGNFSRARLMLKSHNYIQNMLSDSRLNPTCALCKRQLGLKVVVFVVSFSLKQLL